MFKFKKIKRTILFVHISGGLGNQLFQLNNVIELIRPVKRKKFILIFLYTGNPQIKKSHEFPRLSDLGVQSLCVNQGLAKWLIRLLKILGRLNLTNLLIEGRNSEKKLISGINFVEGLYQRKPNKTSTRFLRSKMKFKLTSDKYNVLHIRLGDYLSEESRNNIGLVTNQFYQECLKTLNSHGYPIWIVSDGEKEQIDQILKDAKISYQIKRSESDLKDLEFIANAQIVAVCNSTFSLWACYIKDKQNVYYPSSWFPAKPELNERNSRVDLSWSPIKN